MADQRFLNEIKKRRTFAIISHPDAGKTTLTEKLLLFGGAITHSGTVKGKKSSKHATSDWMDLEKQRGISVSSSVMQFPYRNHIVNLLDTPGHEDFSEDTYRTLTAVDSALMVIDCAKGVEERTIKLMEVSRQRDTPIFTFINKLDREGRDPMEVLDEVEAVLKIRCSPVTWPIGMGKRFRGVYHMRDDHVHLFSAHHDGRIQPTNLIEGLHNPKLDELLGEQADEMREEIELVQGASHPFDLDAYLRGELSPVYFGSAVNNFGVQELLDDFVRFAPPPQPQETEQRIVNPEEENFTGFVFKTQANMDPSHRDRIAFLRICSGQFTKGIKLNHVRIKRTIQIATALNFFAAEREHVETACAGDIIGLHNHGTIQIGDTFTQGEELKFTGIPHFAPELFRRAQLRDPLRTKALLKGLSQLCEEGATQLFRPLLSNDLILGAVGILQFDVAAHRLANEYSVDSSFEMVDVSTARWIESDDRAMLQKFRDKAAANLAIDHSGALVYLAPTRVNLHMAMERWPDIRFNATREM